MDLVISSDNFILLFITLKQIELLEKGESNIWSINYNSLKEFISINKKVSRYRDVLEGFSFINGVSKELVIALNKCINKHVITTFVDDEIYLSRVNIKYYLINMYPEIVDVLEDFLNDFNTYLLDPEGYISIITESMTDSKIVEATLERNMFLIGRNFTNNS